MTGPANIITLSADMFDPATETDEVVAYYRRPALHEVSPAALDRHIESLAPKCSLY